MSPEAEANECSLSKRWRTGRSVGGKHSLSPRRLWKQLNEWPEASEGGARVTARPMFAEVCGVVSMVMCSLERGGDDGIKVVKRCDDKREAAGSCRKAEPLGQEETTACMESEGSKQGCSL